MEKKSIVSKSVENVVCTMGTQSRKPNQVIMAVPDDYILEALNFYRENKKNEEIETGLVRFELVAVYEDGEAEPESPIDEMIEKLDEVVE